MHQNNIGYPKERFEAVLFPGKNTAHRNKEQMDALEFELRETLKLFRECELSIRKLRELRGKVEEMGMKINYSSLEHIEKIFQDRKLEDMKWAIGAVFTQLQQQIESSENITPPPKGEPTTEPLEGVEISPNDMDKSLSKIPANEQPLYENEDETWAPEAHYLPLEESEEDTEQIAESNDGERGGENDEGDDEGQRKDQISDG